MLTTITGGLGLHLSRTMTTQQVITMITVLPIFTLYFYPFSHLPQYYVVDLQRSHPPIYLLFAMMMLPLQINDQTNVIKKYIIMDDHSA